MASEPDITLAELQRRLAAQGIAHLDMRPVRSTSPDAYLRGVKPKGAPTLCDLANRSGTSTPVR